ncbi:MAG: glycosyltransferase family 2 protein [Deltaproteobacteria bacterium]|nr:glycosyltransferase family 2 protein [Deltaproteobacteria bacterium]
MSSPLVSIVIINWNGLKFLEKCLKSLFHQTYHDFEIILVDNGSTDGSVQFVKDKYPQVIILENKNNAGFAAANNQGIRAAGGKYIVLLNNDTEADKDWLKNLVSAAGDSDTHIGMWACKILSLHDISVIDSVGGLLISKCGIAKGRGRNEKDVKQYDREEEVFIPSACAAMYRKEALDQVGLFDEEFFAYCEDTDLGMRARLAGWKTLAVPDAVVYHHYSGTTGKYTPMKAYLVERNHLWVAVKNFPISMLMVFPIITLWRYIFHIYAIATKRGAGGRYTDRFSKTSLFVILLKAYKDAIKGIPKMLKKRHSIMGKRMVSHREIKNWFKDYGIMKISDLVFKE